MTFNRTTLITAKHMPCDVQINHTYKIYAITSRYSTSMACNKCNQNAQVSPYKSNHQITHFSWNL